MLIRSGNVPVLSEILKIVAKGKLSMSLNINKIFVGIPLDKTRQDNSCFTKREINDK